MLIPIDLAASSYQLLNLSLVVFLLDGLWPITDLVSFGVGAFAPSFLSNYLLPIYVLIRRSRAIFVGSAVWWGAGYRSSRHRSAICHTKWSNDTARML